MFNLLKRPIKFLLTLFTVCFFASVIPMNAQSGMFSEKVLSQKNDPLQKDMLSPNIRGSGIAFTQNKGQLIDMDGKSRPDILYKGDFAGADIFLRKTGISYVFNNMNVIVMETAKQVEELIEAGKISEAYEKKRRMELLQSESRLHGMKVHRVDMDFIDCNSDLNANTANEDVVEGYSNYYFPHCADGIVNVKQHNKITYKNIYKNIDVSYFGNKETGVKYDIIVNPHADPGLIKLRWTGAERIYINREGHLVVKTSINEFVESIPKVYQNINGKIIDIKTNYVLANTSVGDAVVHFSFSNYNSSFPLVIDPWISYYGGANADVSGALTIDPSGNVLFTGSTISLNFPVSVGAIQVAFAGKSTNFLGDVFVVKMDANGNRLWATYYGGSESEVGYGISTDNVGNVCVVGTTESALNFPIGFSGANIVHQGSSGSAFSDAFLLKLDPSGIRLFCTFYGGSSMEEGADVTTDGSNIYLYGETSSVNAISTVGSFQPILNGSDVFVAKFVSNGTRLWGTYVGGAGGEGAGGIHFDKFTGSICFSGTTTSNNFPVGFVAGNVVHQAAFSGGINDGFVFKMGNTGSRLWATYYGGTGREDFADITVDGLGNVIFTGSTASLNNISSVASYQFVFGGGGADGFMVKFAPNGMRQWATYMGGNQYDYIGRVATDSENYIYAFGDWEDAGPGTYPISACAYQSNFGGGGEDQFIAKYDPAGIQKCITHLGGTREDELDGVVRVGGGIEINGKKLYFLGTTDGGYPVTAGYQMIYGGYLGVSCGTGCTFWQGGLGDVFIGQICINICEAKMLGLNYTSTLTTVCENAPIKFSPSVANSCDTSGYRFHWTFSGGNPASSDSVKPTVMFSGVGGHDVKLVLTTVCKKDSVTKINYITTSQCLVCNLVGQFVKGTSNCVSCGCKEWIMVTATGGTSPYSYSWPGGYNKRYLSNLCPGNYTINIKDKNGCSINVGLTAP